MNDVLYLLITLTCFGLLAALVGLIDRRLGADADTETRRNGA